MTIYKDPRGDLIHQGQQYTAPNGVTYPAGNDLSVLGYPVVAETPRPEDPGLVVLGWHEENLSQVWETRAKTPDEIKAELNAPILRQIAALDMFIPRGLEDLIAVLAVDVTKLPQVQQDRLAQKAALRAQLVR